MIRIDFMKERVHHVVAHISSCRVGDKRRNMVCFQSRNNVLDRKGGKVGRRAAGNDGLILGLIPVIVRDGGISEIDCDPLDGKSGIASGLPHANMTASGWQALMASFNIAPEFSKETGSRTFSMWALPIRSGKSFIAS